MNHPRYCRISILVFLLSLAVLAFQGVAKPSPASDTIKETHAREMISQFKQKIIAHQLELIDLERDLEWLNYKINSLTYANRPVLPNLYTTLQYKTDRVTALKKEKAYCKSRIAYFRKQVKPPVKNKPAAMQKKKVHDLEARIEKAGLSDWLDIQKDEETGDYQLKTILPILFASGSAKIVKEYQDFLKNLAVLIKDIHGTIVVEGYADIDPIHTPKYPSNFELGATRAANVVHSLVKNGVKPNLFKISSTGKYRLLPLKMSKNKTLERYVNIIVNVQG